MFEIRAHLSEDQTAPLISFIFYIDRKNLEQEGVIGPLTSSATIEVNTDFFYLFFFDFF